MQKRLRHPEQRMLPCLPHRHRGASCGVIAAGAITAVDRIAEWRSLVSGAVGIANCSGL